MGHIKEPKGVDFIIKSKPLTNEERAAISKFTVSIKQNILLKKSQERRDFHLPRKEQPLDNLSASRRALQLCVYLLMLS